MKIVFFDGYCNLCNGFVDRLMKIDSARKLQFASLQGKTAQRLFGELRDPVDLATVVYWRDGRTYERSTAILLILNDVGGIWKLVRIFLALPRFFRDAIYQTIARHRYRLFGKKETCRVPTAQESQRLLE